MNHFLLLIKNVIKEIDCFKSKLLEQHKINLRQNSVTDIFGLTIEVY